MSILDRLLFRPVQPNQAAPEQRALGDDLAALFLGATPALSGITISPTTALQVPAVRAAVELLAGVLGSLPVKIIRPLAAGGKEADPDHPAARLVSRDANPWMTAGALRQQLAVDALLRGDAYALTVRDGQGEARETVRLDPSAVRAETDTATGEPRYSLSTGTGQRSLHWRDVIHVRPVVSLDGLHGQAPIRTAREAIALCIAAEAYFARLFATGGRPSGILSFPDRLTAESAARMKKSWQAATSGENAGGTAVLDENGKFQPLGFTSVDQQFAELRAFQVIEIARAFGLPPSFVGDFSRATWSNAAESNRQFVQFSLLPWVRSFEAAYRRTLLTDEDRANGLTIEFTLDALLQGTPAERAEFIAKLRAAGTMTANEARRIENLPALPGGDDLQNPYTTSAKTTPAAGGQE